MSLGHRVTCQACGGASLDKEGKPCPACHGTGYRWTSPTPDVKPGTGRKDRRG